jgi:hypothetical protein
MVVPGFSGVQHFDLAPGSVLKNAVLGMRSGGIRRLLVNFPAEFNIQNWLHYGAQVLQIHLNSVDSRG